MHCMHTCTRFLYYNLYGCGSDFISERGGRNDMHGCAWVKFCTTVHVVCIVVKKLGELLVGLVGWCVNWWGVVYPCIYG